MEKNQSPDVAAASAGSSPFQNLHEIVRQARTNLHQNSWDYIAGGTETETTLRRNRMALDSIAFRPRVLVDVSEIDSSVNVFGRKLRLPVMMAPVGSLDAFEPGGGATVSKAAEEFGCAHMLSSAANPGLEKVAEAAPKGLRIFQLYVRGDDKFVEDYVERAIKNGYTAFALTVDVARHSRRERDIAKRYLPPARRGSLGPTYQAALNWSTVKLIKDKYKIPLIVKGVATAEDAKKCVDHGVEWVYVSNHGGRQLDHGIGSIDAVPEVVEAVAGRAKIMVDGGFNRGTDVVKAIIAGADLVGMGRMQCYGLAAGGQSGIVRMLEILEDEVQRCLGLLGVRNFAELDKTYVRPAAPANQPGPLSAFPLLDLHTFRY